ncbi:hypothetical protein CFR73_15465 [Novacetimonas maltaceti]|nr:hypothetical protein CFR73_15465 [Novacetimonas maltaceti]
MDDPLDRSEAAGTSAAPLGGASTGGTYRASDRYPDGRRQTATAAQRRAAAGSGELAGRQVQRTWLAALRTRAEIKPPKKPARIIRTGHLGNRKKRSDL